MDSAGGISGGGRNFGDQCRPRGQTKGNGQGVDCCRPASHLVAYDCRRRGWAMGGHCLGCPSRGRGGSSREHSPLPKSYCTQPKTTTAFLWCGGETMGHIITIVDYGRSNLLSVQRGFEYWGNSWRRSRRRSLDLARL